MKILQVIPALNCGGAERFTVDLSNYIANHFNEEVVLVITKDITQNGNDYYLQDVSNKVKIIILNCKYGFSLDEYFRMLKIIHKEHPDIIHSQGTYLSLILPHFLYPKVKILLTIHTLPERWVRSSWRKKLTDWIFSNFIKAITISDICHNNFISIYHKSIDKLIFNGREPLKLTDKVEEVRNVIDGFKTQIDTPVFIHVARAHPVKNHVRLFKTFHKLQKENVDFVLLILGSGYEVYDKELINNPHFHFMGSCNNVGDYMAYSDFFVLSSDKEGLPLTLLEAMSMGVIPICTPAGGIVDVITNGENGYLSEDNTDISFYNAIKRALNERGLINSQSVINEYKAKYSMESCANSYMNEYKQLLNENLNN